MRFTRPVKVTVDVTPPGRGCEEARRPSLALPIELEGIALPIELEGANTARAAAVPAAAVSRAASAARVVAADRSRAAHQLPRASTPRRSEC